MISNLFVANLTIEELRKIIGDEFSRAFKENTPKPVVKLLKPLEACSYLRITRPTLTDWVNKGKVIEHRPAPRAPRYKLNELEEALRCIKKYQPVKAA